jgi:hypothetical protein
VSAQVQPEALGPVVQVRAILTIAAIPNWQAPAGSSSDLVPEQTRLTEQKD